MATTQESNWHVLNEQILKIRQIGREEEVLRQGTLLTAVSSQWDLKPTLSRTNIYAVQVLIIDFIAFQAIQVYSMTCCCISSKRHSHWAYKVQ